MRQGGWARVLGMLRKALRLVRRRPHIDRLDPAQRRDLGLPERPSGPRDPSREIDPHRPGPPFPR